VAVGGFVAAPSTVLLGRPDGTVLCTTWAVAQCSPAGLPLRWKRPGWRRRVAGIRGRSARSPLAGARGEVLPVELVDPVLVAEVAADVALDAAGRWRHPVR
jgi:hypothetical protein